METVTDFIFLGSKITVGGDCSHEIQRRLLLGRKAMTDLDSTWKSRGITLLTKVWYSQSYGFSSSHVQMWESDHKESWALKNWCFQIVVLEKILENPLDCKEINQSILKEINPEYSLKGLKMKRQYFGHLMQRADSWEMTLLLGKIDGRRRSEQQRMRWLNGIIDSLEFEQILRDSEGQRSLVGCSLWGCKESDTTEWLSNKISNKNNWATKISNYLKTCPTGFSLRTECLILALHPELLSGPVKN